MEAFTLLPGVSSFVIITFDENLVHILIIAPMYRVMMLSR